MHDRDALIAATDLRQLADELLGHHAGSERSPTWQCPNPHHPQTGRTPPVTIFTSRRGEQRWRCHGCGSGGTAIDLVMACHGVDLRGALDHLAHRLGKGRCAMTAKPARYSKLAARVPIDPVCRDLEALTTYVDECARNLWLPEGRPIRTWLTDERRLPEDVLRKNRIGADLGRHQQPRPDGMPNAAGAVLPAIENGQAVYAQIRVIAPRCDGPRYLNPRADLAANPRLARFRPALCEHDEVIVTEGCIDALSANAAGYRAVAVLSAGCSDESVAHALARLPYPLVLAFDADAAGRSGGAKLEALLVAAQRQPVILDLRAGDLNDALVQSCDWRRELPQRLARLQPSSRSDRPHLLSL